MLALEKVGGRRFTTLSELIKEKGEELARKALTQITSAECELKAIPVKDGVSVDVNLRSFAFYFITYELQCDKELVNYFTTDILQDALGGHGCADSKQLISESQALRAAILKDGVAVIKQFTPRRDGPNHPVGH